MGAFLLVNHGIPSEVRKACAEACAWFHRQDPDWKKSFAIARSRGNKGYVPEDLSPTGFGRVVRDYASMDVGTEIALHRSDERAILLGPNQWPDDERFRAAVETYRGAVQNCADSVAGMLARVCGLDEDHLARRSASDCSLLRLLHYPRPSPVPDAVIDGHTDYEWFSLVWQSSEGLEFFGRDGRRHQVPALPGAVAVLIGDLLEVLSGGFLESTLHWVRPRLANRYSLTYFHGPGYDEVIRPIPVDGTEPVSDYPPLHAGRHLTALRVRHFAHLRTAHAEGSLPLPFELPEGNPLKAVKARRLARTLGAAR